MPLLIDKSRSYGSSRLKLNGIRIAGLVILIIAGGSATQAQESTATRDRRAGNGAAAEATVTINEQFLNSFLTAIFDNLSEPSMPLTVGGARPTGQCASEIRLKREVDGVRTAVHFEEGRIVGPLAFAGSYSAPFLGCIELSGWADAEVKLEFDNQRRALVARFFLRDIHLSNAPGVLSGSLLNVVQTAIDRRYNPVELFTLEKLSTRVEIQPAGGALQLHAKEIRPEISPTALTLHITYEFTKG